jgi:hypothetical protein
MSKQEKLMRYGCYFMLPWMILSASFGQFVPPPPPPPPPGLPIDGGLLILAIMGAVYGAKKLKK